MDTSAVRPASAWARGAQRPGLTLSLAPRWGAAQGADCRANSRSTTSRFRLALHRCPGAKAPAPTAAGTSARPNAVARVSQQGGWVPGAPTPDHETRLARRSLADRLPPRLGRPSFLRRSSRDRRNRPTYNEKTAVSPGAIPECEHPRDWVAERVGFEPTVEFPLHTLSKRAPSTTRTSLRVSGCNR